MKDTPQAWEIVYKRLINPWDDDKNMNYHEKDINYRIFREIYKGLDIARVIHRAILCAPDKDNITAGPNISLIISSIRSTY